MKRSLDLKLYKFQVIDRYTLSPQTVIYDPVKNSDYNIIYVANNETNRKIAEEFKAIHKRSNSIREVEALEIIEKRLGELINSVEGYLNNNLALSANNDDRERAKLALSEIYRYASKIAERLEYIKPTSHE